MKQIKLNAKVREDSGRSASRQFRREGEIPAVIYGESGNRMLSLNNHEFMMAHREFANRAALIELSIEGQDVSTYAVVQELQRNTRTDAFLHIDFKEIVRGKDMETEVPVQTVGRAAGVRNFGGVLEVNLPEVAIRCRPRDLPEAIVIDVTELGIGKSLHLSDIKMPEGVTLLDDPKLVVVSCVGASGGASTEDAEAEEAD